MRTIVGWFAWALLGVSAVLVVRAWLQDAPDLDSDDAVDVAVDALHSVGKDVTPRASTPDLVEHERASGGLVEAWSVELAVDGGEAIEVRVQRDAGKLIFVDDRVGEADQQRALTDEQFAELEGYRDDSVVDGWIMRNVIATVALLVGAVVTIVLTRGHPELEDAST